MLKTTKNEFQQKIRKFKPKMLTKECDNDYVSEHVKTLAKHFYKKIPSCKKKYLFLI